MGNYQDIMHGFVRQEMNRFFSTYDGWTITPVKQVSGYDQEFIAERSISGNKESQKVLVSFEKNVPKEKLEAMRSTDRGPYGQSFKSDVAIIVPQNSDTSKVPADVRLLFMKSFAFQGDMLAWMKKPEKKPEEKKQ